MATLGELDQARAATGQTGAMPRGAYAAPSRQINNSRGINRQVQQLTPGRGMGQQVRALTPAQPKLQPVTPDPVAAATQQGLQQSLDQRQPAPGLQQSVEQRQPAQPQLTLGQVDQAMKATGVSGAMPRGYDTPIIQQQMADKHRQTVQQARQALAARPEVQQLQALGESIGNRRPTPQEMMQIQQLQQIVQSLPESIQADKAQQEWQMLMRPQSALNGQ